MTGTDRMADSDAERLQKEIAGQLARARALLALAHKMAIKMPIGPEDQVKSNTSLAEAIGLCVTATRAAKANNLYRLLDSGLNPSELRQSVERALRKPVSSKPPPRRVSGRSGNSIQVSLFAQLDACRRLNAEGARWLSHVDSNADDTWRGKQLMKIAEQLCVVTALESKLFGEYVIGDSRDEPAAVRKTVNFWATEATRKELTDE